MDGGRQSAYVDLVPTGGQDHDHRLRTGLAQLPGQLDTVEVGQPEVDQDEIGPGVGDQPQRIAARGRPPDLVAVRGEAVTQRAADDQVIFDHQ